MVTKPDTEPGPIASTLASASKAHAAAGAGGVTVAVIGIIQHFWPDAFTPGEYATIAAIVTAVVAWVGTWLAPANKQKPEMLANVERYLKLKEEAKALKEQIEEQLARTKAEADRLQELAKAEAQG